MVNRNDEIWIEEKESVPGYPDRGRKLLNWIKEKLKRGDILLFASASCIAAFFTVSVSPAGFFPPLIQDLCVLLPLSSFFLSSFVSFLPSIFSVNFYFWSSCLKVVNGGLDCVQLRSFFLYQKHAGRKHSRCWNQGKMKSYVCF